MKLADAIADYVLGQVRKHLRRVGTVSGTSGAKVIVIVDGASMTLPRLSSYTPTIGDVVHIDTTGDGWIVYGKTA